MPKTAKQWVCSLDVHLHRGKFMNLPYPAPSSSTYRDHVKSVHDKTNDKPCEFPGCGKVFPTASRLNKHAVIHTGEKRFHCEETGCPVKTFTAESLVEHCARDHGGPKKHCPRPLCDMWFVTASERSRHVRVVHDHIKPYLCFHVGCEHSSGTSDNRRVHMTTCTYPAEPIGVRERALATAL
jgi:hypothetical protein